MWIFRYGSLSQSVIFRFSTHLLVSVNTNFKSSPLCLQSLVTSLCVCVWQLVPHMHNQLVTVNYSQPAYKTSAFNSINLQLYDCLTKTWMWDTFHTAPSPIPLTCKRPSVLKLSNYGHGSSFLCGLQCFTIFCCPSHFPALSIQTPSVSNKLLLLKQTITLAWLDRGVNCFICWRTHMISSYQHRSTDSLTSCSVHQKWRLFHHHSILFRFYSQTLIT